jgi:translation elongation factor EF-1alpha
VDQGSFQGGTNINEDNDVVIGRCNDGHIQVNDEDEVTQTNKQSSNQEVNSDNEEEEEADSD